MRKGRVVTSRLRHLRDDEIVAGLDGELGAVAHRRVVDHLDECETCRRRGDDLRAVSLAVRIAVRTAADHDIDHVDDARRRLQQALRRQSAPAASRRATAAIPWPWTFAAAAAVVVLAVVGLDMRAHPGGGNERADTAVVTSSLPIASFTPGSTMPLTAAQLCSGQRPAPVVAADVARQVIARYGMERVSPSQYELDALITPELGGTADAANLWPQRYDGTRWNAHVKDAVETRLHDMVCRGEIPLATAQREIATDWIAAYRKYVDARQPSLSGTAGLEDDDGLVIAVAVHQPLAMPTWLAAAPLRLWRGAR
jgi:hypothetical protein